MKWSSLAFGGLLVWSFNPASAEQIGSSCVAIASDVARLECFDDAFTHLAAAPRDPAVEICEKATVYELVSPSTYKFVSSIIDKNVVLLEYDAQNGFGALVRGISECAFYARDDLFYIATSRDGVVLLNRYGQNVPIPRNATSLDYEAGVQQRRGPVRGTSLDLRKLAGDDPTAGTRSDKDLIDECRSKLDASAGNPTVSVVQIPTGSKEIYVRYGTGGGPFSVAKCVFEAGEFSSSAVIAP
jgi:hypothetical protein